MSQEDKGSNFQVKDRRRFNPDGSIREETGQDTEVQSQQKEKEEPSRGAQEKAPQFEINFPTFILSLASSVQISLGLIPHPATHQPHIDLVSAKQTIDILGMLEEKTKGNLTKEEVTLLSQILFELRMQFVEVSKKMKG